MTQRTMQQLGEAARAIYDTLGVEDQANFFDAVVDKVDVDTARRWLWTREQFLEQALKDCGDAARGERSIIKRHAPTRDLSEWDQGYSGSPLGIRVNTVGNIVRMALES